MTEPKLNTPKPVDPAQAKEKPAKPGTERARQLAAIDQPAPKEDEPSGYHPPAPPWMSEGARQEIEMYGETTDPNTGQRLTRADLPYND